MTRAQRKGVAARKVGGRPTLPTFLIVCEGEKTEPQYFRQFGIPSVQVDGAGMNTTSLVEHAIRLSKRDSVPRDHYWIVFDRDSFSAQSFNAAISKARAAGFEVAYSNEAFEIWYLLHFEYFTSGIDRRLYREKLSERLGRTYEKNDPTIFNALRDRQEEAIKYATKLLDSYGANHSPEKDNPCTTVHKLVEKLRGAAAAKPTRLGHAR